MDRFEARWLAVVFAVLTALTLVTRAPAEEESDGPAIPPGQEQLLLAMLGKGAQLPDGCRLTAGGVEYTVVKATYACKWGEVEIELTHPERAPSAAVETERFAIAVQEGSPPESFTDAIALLVHAREGAFEWVWPAEEDAEAGGDPP